MTDPHLTILTCAPTPGGFAHRRVDQPAVDNIDRTGCPRNDDRDLGRPVGCPDCRRENRPQRYSNYFTLGVSMSLTGSALS